MSLRSEDGIAEQVADLIRDYHEIKNAQLTSQDSGMQFKEITPVTEFIDIVPSQGWGEVWMVTNRFKPDHDRPAICVPHMDIQVPSSLRWEWSYNYFLNLESAIVLDSDDNVVATVDVWHFLHRRGTVDGSYSWQSLFYTWGSIYATMTVKISLRATDTGTHTIQVETAEQG